jgi:hypothetical protein
LIKAAIASPTPVKILLNDFTLDNAAITSLGPTTLSQLNIVGIAEPPTSTLPAVAALKQELINYAPQPYTMNDGNLIQVATAQLAIYAAEHLASVTAAGVYAFLSHDTDYLSGEVPPSTS